MGKVDDPLDELEAEDMGDFERHRVQSSFNLNPLAGHELFSLRQEQREKRHLATTPPIKLYVSKIPPALNQDGLRNIFSKFGELREVSQPRFSGGQEFKYAFVSLSSRREALAAIENVTERPPLFLEVQFSRDEKEANRKRLMDEEIERFGRNNPMPKEAEEEEDEDWEKEIEEEKKRQSDVDQFMEDDKDEEFDLVFSAQDKATGGARKKSGANQLLSPVKDSSGVDVFLESDLPEADLKTNSMVNILESRMSQWAIIRIPGFPKQLEDKMKTEATEFLGSSPCKKQLCVYERSGKFVRVTVDSPTDSIKETGEVKFHGIDDDTRVKLDDWRLLRYLPSSLLQYPPHLVTVRMVSPQPPGAEVVKIIYKGDRKGYPLVEMERVTSDSSDTCSDYEKTVSEQPKTQEEQVKRDCIEKEKKSDPKRSSANSEAAALHIGLSERVHVTHLVSPAEIYVVKERDKFYKFCANLNKKAESLPSPTEFSAEVGSVLLVQASDTIWYRGEVLSVEGSRFTFYAADFGFIEEVKKKSAKEIPDSLESLKTTNYFAIRCCLSDWDSGSPPTSSEIKDIKKKLPITGRSMKVRVLSQREDSYIVDVEGISRDA